MQVTKIEMERTGEKQKTNIEANSVSAVLSGVNAFFFLLVRISVIIRQNDTYCRETIKLGLHNPSDLKTKKGITVQECVRTEPVMAKQQPYIKKMEQRTDSYHLCFPLPFPTTLSLTLSYY